MGKDTSVREVLEALQSDQWRREFTQMQKTRAHDLGGEPDVAFTDILEKHFRHYKGVTADLRKIGPDGVQKAQASGGAPRATSPAAPPSPRASAGRADAARRGGPARRARSRPRRPR